MRRLHSITAIAAAFTSLIFSSAASAQHGASRPQGPYSPGGILPPTKQASSVRITKGPELESAQFGLAIIRWTSNNPGGTDEHWGVVHYGVNPKNLDQVAKSHIRLNRSHPETIFRVRVDGLKPKVTYYYTVDSAQASGKSDGMKSPVMHFTMPGDPVQSRAPSAGKAGQ
jgi:hypothetical protein